MIKLDGNVTMEEWGLNGKLLRSQCARNSIVASGLNLSRDLLLGIGKGIQWMAIGQGLTTTGSDVHLTSEWLRQAPTSKLLNNNQITLKLFVPAISSVNGNVVDSAILASGGKGIATSATFPEDQVFAKVSLAAITKSEFVSLVLIWVVNTSVR